MDSFTSGLPLRKTAHPRRPPAHNSISLYHDALASRISPEEPTFYQSQTTSASSSNAPANGKVYLSPCISPKAQSNKDKHSPGVSSDAGEWFESTDNAGQSNPFFPDNGPLSYLPNSCIPHIAQDDHVLRDYSYRQASMPYCPSRCGASSSASAKSGTMEEFQSVIDDLTVANKKLKQQLKKYERLYDDHLQDEKLFEIRFHGLADHKKRELVEILRKFAADIEKGPNADYQRTTKARHNQRQTIQSYLGDIPVNLVAQNQVALTEESKKKLVVRRLEQIFAGRHSAPRSQLQPMQQEEVAQLAAIDDRRMREATGQCSEPEGNREARIIPARADEESITVQNVLLEEFLLIPSVHEHGFEGPKSPGQRPTRPLDLDLHQAEVPAKNLEYIRHLGFSPLNMTSGGSPQDDREWLYLNLLCNMAQLHTVNVTPDFVKDAITEYSSKFELSHDGQKVRWRGSREVTTSGGDSLSNDQEKHLPYDICGHSESSANQLEIKPDNNAGLRTDPKRQVERNNRTQNKQDQNKYPYIPLFSRGNNLYDGNDLYDFSMNSSSNWSNQAPQSGDFSEFGGSALRSCAKRCGNSPMIFYSKAKFYTDLTSDRYGCSNIIPGSYTSVRNSVLGDPIPQQHLMCNPISGIGELRGPFGSYRMDIDSTESQQDSSNEDVDFSLDALKNDSGTENFGTMDFEASGLGGVHLGDNFSIHVRRSRLQITPSYLRPTGRKLRLYSQKILGALNEGLFPESETSLRQERVFEEDILSTSRKSLPSSMPPPASFLAFDSTSSGDVDSDLESDMSSE